MYLILINTRSLGQEVGYTYNSIFTESILDVAQAFRDGRGTIKVYKIDSLTEVKEIDIQIQEMTKEMV